MIENEWAIPDEADRVSWYMLPDAVAENPIQRAKHIKKYSYMTTPAITESQAKQRADARTIRAIQARQQVEQ